MPVKSFFIAVCVLLLSYQAQSQLRLVAIPGKETVEVGEVFQLQFVIEGAKEVDEFMPPAFRQLERTGSVIQSSGWTWVNGSLAEYVSYTYQLRARTKGTIPVASAIAKIKGKMLSSQPLVIKVVERSVNPSAVIKEEQPDFFLAPGEDPQEKIKKNLFVKVILDKQTCFVGEPVIATFKLYTRLESESKIIKRPSFNGFSVADLAEPENGMFQKELVNGKMYSCYLLRKVMLFPLQSGELEIEQVEIQNRVRLIKPDESSKGKNWLQDLVEKMKNAELTQSNVLEESYTAVSPAIKITVKELPEETKPQGYNGAVGDFLIGATLQQSTFNANETGILKLRISGYGNLTMLTLPVVQWPSGIEVFEAKSNEEIDKNSNLLQGAKLFEIPFSAKEGHYKIPPVEFSFFDPEANQYKTIYTDSLELDVKKAPLQARLKQENVSASTEKVVVPDLYYWAGGSVALLLLLFVFFMRRRKAIVQQPMVPVQEVEQPVDADRREVDDFLFRCRRLKDATNKKQFVQALLDGVNEYFTDRLNTGHQQAVIVSILESKQLIAVATQYRRLVHHCELILFSPVEMNMDAAQLLQEAERLLQEAEKELVTLR